MDTLSNRERMQIARQEMPELNPEKRRLTFEEVNLGFTAELAKMEALRCLQCPKPACIEGCPVRVKITDFIQLVSEGDFLGAAAKIKEDNVLPAICGRVCPQEEQCEAKCVVAKKKEPVAIGRLERFVADFEREHAGIPSVTVPPFTGKRVAIVGSGPAGLSCAADLAQKGHRVSVFEALHELGGVLIYGIPEFRLPKEIVRAEIEAIQRLGVEFQKDMVVGLSNTVDELFSEGYDAVFLGVGAGLPYFLNIPGENLVGVYSANEFLTRVNLMRAYRFPEADTPIYDCRNKEVLVFGGGNTAMDAVRTARRLGASRAMICYRRTEQDMPARAEEIHHAKDEGIEFMTLVNPVEFLGAEDGWLQSARLIRMRPGEPDASGRCSPVPVPESEFEIQADVAIVAIGNGSNPILRQTTPGLAFNKRGNLIVDPETMKTSRRGVFAGGDIVTGGATVILAMGAGRKAASAIDAYLNDASAHWPKIGAPQQITV